MSEDHHTIRTESIKATVKAHGAELCSLRNVDGCELLWQAGVEWPRHSPLLFPVVGRLKNDELRHRGKTFPMAQHGFARDQRFEWVARGDSHCSLALADNHETRARFPFEFRLIVTFALNMSELNVVIEINNTSSEILPASLGAHPAFNWPLLPGLAKEDYTVIFSDEERAPVRRLKDGLLRAEPEASPVKAKRLALSEGLFKEDAIIFDRLESRAVRYAAKNGPSIELSWEGFRELGIWSKPAGAPFLCIEPWYGFASPSNFDGEFVQKPGLMYVAPTEKRTLKYCISVG